MTIPLRRKFLAQPRVKRSVLISKCMEGTPKPGPCPKNDGAPSEAGGQQPDAAVKPDVVLTQPTAEQVEQGRREAELAAQRGRLRHRPEPTNPPSGGGIAPDRFQTHRPMPVGSVVTSREALTAGGTSSVGPDGKLVYEPIREFAPSQERLEVVAHRGGEDTGKAPEVLVRNSKGEEMWIERRLLRGKTSGKGRREISKRREAPEEPGEAGRFGPRIEPGQGKALDVATLKKRAAAEGRTLPLAQIARLNREISHLLDARVSLPISSFAERQRLGEEADRLKNERDRLAGVRVGESVSEYDMQQLKSLPAVPPTPFRRF